MTIASGSFGWPGASVEVTSVGVASDNEEVFGNLRRLMTERASPDESRFTFTPTSAGPLNFHFSGTREELIAAFREAVAETYGPDRVEEIMRQQDWYEPSPATETPPATP